MADKENMITSFGTGTSTIKQMLDEMTLASRDILYKKGVSPYENPDKIISQRGIAYIQNEVERDTHYMSCLTTRVNALIKKGYRILPASTAPRDLEIRDFVEHCLTHMQSEFETDIAAMMSAISRGYSLSEMNYKIIDRGRFKDKYGLKNIRYKQQAWFTFEFDKYGYYTPIQWDPERIVLKSNKFIHLINGLDDENPYGYSIGSICSFYTWLKKQEFKFWAVFSERFGMPLPKVEVPSNTAPGDLTDLAANKLLEAVNYDTGVKVPKGLILEFLEATRTGDAGYSNFIKMCDAEISKAVLGQTLTVENTQGTGSAGLGSVHSDVLSAYTLFDTIITQSAFNLQLIKRLVDLNYADVDQYPKFSWKITESGLLAIVAQALPQLVQSGLPVSKKWVYEILRMMEPESEEDILEAIPQNIGNPGIGGVDNRAGNSYQQKRIKAEQIEFAANVIKETAQNESIVGKYVSIASKTYKELISKIIKLKSFNADVFPEWINQNIAPILQEILILGKMKGMADAIAEGDRFQVSGDRFREEKSRCNLKDTTTGKEEFAIYKPFDTMIEDYLARGVISKSEYDLLSEEMKRKAFALSGVEAETTLKSIKDKIQEVLAGNLSNLDFESAVESIFDTAGLTIRSASRLETILRTNLQTTYGEGRFKVFDELDADEFPALQIVSIMDSRVRASHAALNGFTRYKTDPIWGKLRTPFSFNCRCAIKAIHKSELFTITEKEPDTSDLDFIK